MRKYMKSGMSTYTVRLKDGTVGYVTSANAPNLGYEMTVTFKDASGKQATATGVVDAILDAKATWIQPQGQ